MEKFKVPNPDELMNLDIYPHIKENIVNHLKNCTEPLSKSTSYCFTCKHSVCNQCGLNDHKEHLLIAKGKFLKYNKDFSTEIEKVLIKSQSLEDQKNEAKTLVFNSVKSLHAKLDEIEKEKLKQIDVFYNDIQTNLGQIKQHFDSTKESIETYYKQNEVFFNDTGNNDRDNMIFLMNFEIMNLCDNKNNLTLDTVKTLSSIISLHDRTIEEKTKKAIQDIEHYLDFEYSLNKIDDYYFDVRARTIKYNEHIQSFKKSIFDIVKTQGAFDRLNDLVDIYDSKNTRGIDLLFNQNYFVNKDNENTANNSNNNTRKIRLRGHNHRHTLTQSKSGGLNSIRSKQVPTNNSPQKASTLNPFSHLQNDNDVILENSVIQRFFTYTLFDLYGKSFAKTKEKNPYQSEFYMRSYTERSDKLKEYAKPVLGTNEIALYNHQTNFISKVSVKLDKEIHGYSTFPHGCRHILIEHHLYITGGIDHLKNKLNDVLCYDLSNNTIKKLNPLLSSHSYHTIEYLDNYDCLIVIGGESNSACEIYDLFTGNWTKLPDLNFQRGNVNIYYDNITSDLYALFGMDNIMIENMSYSNIIEVLEMKDISSGWYKVDYYKSADLNFKINYCTVLPFTRDTLLIYGGNSARCQKKLFALFNMNKNEVLKIDEKSMEKIKGEEKRLRNMDLALEKIK